MKYNKLDGFEIELGTVFKLACCDCGLVHNIAIAKENNDKIGFALERNNKATAQLRRHNFGYLQQGVLNYTMNKLR
uniref:Uncharacterized protein n=1 Tax=viral metagenome TaxID=1070528 RepID=A0A6M3LLP2_9ZZZZ